MDCRLLVLGLAISLAACGQLNESGKFTKSESQDCVSNAIKGEFLVTWKDGHRSVVRALDEEHFKSSFLEKSSDEILFAEPHYAILQEQNSEVSADISATATGDWGIDYAHFKDAWALGMTGQNVLVAVVDSGVDINHPQIAPRVYSNLAELNGRPGIDDDKNGYIDDVNGYNFSTNAPLNNDISGHGTHVSGIILADPSAGRLSGAAYGAKLMPVDFMAFDSDSGQELGTTSAAIIAMDYASRNGAKVINASWGGTLCSASLQAKFNELQSRDVFLAVAAGNSGVDISYSPAYPAVYQGLNQITVGALDTSGIRARYSNYGSLVQLLAPGSAVESTVPTYVNSSGYAFQSGTSMASPYVAAAAAILRGAFPFKSAAEIREALLVSADLYSSNVYPKAKLRVDKASQYLQTH
jgi:subtilisin family serine protease